MKNLIFGLCVLLACMFLVSCGGTKKCNGSKGTRVEMGTM